MKWISIISGLSRGTWATPTYPTHFGQKWAIIRIPQKIVGRNGHVQNRIFAMNQHLIIESYPNNPQKCKHIEKDPTPPPLAHNPYKVVFLRFSRI